MSGAYSEFFSGRGHQISSLFQAQFFPGRVILSNLSDTNDFREVRGHAPTKIFENLHTVMVILALFKQFSGKVCSYFWLLILSALSNMMHFVSTVLIMRA